MNYTATATRIATALDGCPVAIDDTRFVTQPADYLAALPSLTGLLTHLNHAQDPEQPARRRAVAAPPRDAHARGELLTTADQLLAAPRTDTSDRLAALLAVLKPSEGIRAWVRDHTRHSPLLDPLLEPAIDGIATRRQTIGRTFRVLELGPTAGPPRSGVLAASLDHSPATTGGTVGAAPSAVVDLVAYAARRRDPHRRPSSNNPTYDAVLGAPQLFWGDLWRQMAYTSTASEVTGRCFASLALIKTITGCIWADAAQLLELPVRVGEGVARVGQRNLTTSAHDFVKILHELARDRISPSGTDYRARQHLARAVLRTRRHEESLRRHLAAPHLHGALLREKVWGVWALGHPAASPHPLPADKQLRARVATQRFRWTSEDDTALLRWCARRETTIARAADKNVPVVGTSLLAN